MNDDQIHHRIENLVSEEQKLWEREAQAAANGTTAGGSIRRRSARPVLGPPAAARALRERPGPARREWEERRRGYGLAPTRLA